ncbi:S8 family peptidase [Paenibacillus cremeus]|uniref:S8 family peptidase n=2 Tax=Paenibacillus cremeus TaxID=2163881 RepID=A0A559KDX4_9BACL|nr:S8 family peptidase [Paenibacillus cremeus]
MPGHWSWPYRHKLDPDVAKWARWERAATKSAGGKGQHLAVIIQFHRTSRFGRQAEGLRQCLGVLSARRPVGLQMIRSVAVRLPEEGLRRACRLPQVRYIYKDRTKHALLHGATPAIGAAAAQRSGFTGKGIGIAVLDTGVYPHPDLTRPRNRLAAFKDFVQGRVMPYDDNGHGTHCAGDAAGNGLLSKGKYRGPAPEAEVIGVKVLDASGNGSDSMIIRGIQWCLQHRRRYGIRVLSLSFGGPAASSSARDPLCQAVTRAVRKGLVVVTVAGNTGPRRGTITTPGVSPLALTVGAADVHGTTVPSFSGRGPAKGGGTKPDLVAPGVGITSLRAPGSVLDRMLPSARVGRRYFTLSGTSMAAPITAGAAAQLLQRFPKLTPAGVKRALKRHAIRLRRGYGKNVQGSGLLNMRFLR